MESFCPCCYAVFIWFTYYVNQNNKNTFKILLEDDRFQIANAKWLNHEFRSYIDNVAVPILYKTNKILKANLLGPFVFIVYSEGSLRKVS